MGVVCIPHNNPCGGPGVEFWVNLFLAHLVLGQCCYLFLSQTINFQYCNYDCDLIFFPGCSLCEQEKELEGEEGEGEGMSPYTPLEPI